MKQFWNALCREWQLGEPMKEPVRVSGGYMHKMYRLDTPRGSYAVKLLNPEVMARPQALGNYRCALRLEQILEEHALPIVPALSLHGQKLQRAGEQYYQLFLWVDAFALARDEITPAHCACIGALLAKQHAITASGAALQVDVRGGKPEPFGFAWEQAAAEAQKRCNAIAAPLAEALPLLREAQEAYNQAVAALPERTAICNGDMDPKNVLWQNGRPLVIDLECLAWGNPLMDLLPLALDWAGGANQRLDEKRLTAFLAAYRQISGAWALPWQTLTGIGFAWLDWLNYSVRRAIDGEDEETLQTGVQQTVDTLERIRSFAAVRKTATQVFAAVFGSQTEI